MSTWTDSARHALEQYFQAIRPGLSAHGADPEEVIEDLRQLLEREVAATGLGMVTEEDVHRLLARIGAPPPPVPSDPPPSSEAPPVMRNGHTPKRGWMGPASLLVLGVLVPALTLLTEGLSGICAAAFFDPLPTWWHVLLVALVPAGNLLLWLAWRRQHAAWAGFLGWLNGAAVAVAAYYTVLYIPLLLPGVLGILWFGIGLLPLAPVLALVSALCLRRCYRLSVSVGSARWGGFWPGLVLGLLALLAAESGHIATRVGLKMATSGTTMEQTRGLRLLRTLGDREHLLRACYGWTPGAAQMDVWGRWLIPGSTRVSPEKAREIYFRVTGRPFNLEPAPRLRTGRGAWAEVNEWTWDSDHGGDKVGGRIKGLHLHSSRLDLVTDPGAAWSYTEWIMEFRNDSPSQREARAQMLLPPGGVVSRLTLWVDGEEREAAFSGRAQVKEAYRQVAVRQRRDPVLVTTSGPDRVMMQCFPVPPNGGLMKIRLGITAPLTLDQATVGIVRLPCLTERNFSIRQGFTHAVWAQSPGLLTSSNTAVTVEVSSSGASTLRGSLNDTQLSSPGALILVQRAASAVNAWTHNTLGGGLFIRQTVTAEPSPPPSRVAFVVDGSAAMKPHWATVFQALNGWPASTEIVVFVARETEGGDPVLRLDRTAIGSGWGRIEPVGGQDNVPALRRAWEFATAGPDGAVVWIHGLQPMLMESVEPLVQLIERSSRAPVFHELQVEAGPDRVLDHLDGLRLAPSIRRGMLEEDLSALTAILRNGATRWGCRREVAPTESEAKRGNAAAASLHLARLWAAEEVQRLRTQRKIPEAAALAAAHQLVTPVSGAVVLENQAQYRQTGLQPVDPQSVPTIPEPATIWLALTGALALAWTLRRRRAGPGSRN